MKIVIFTLFVVVLLIASTAYAKQRNRKHCRATPTPTPVVSPTITPEVSPEPSQPPPDVFLGDNTVYAQFFVVETLPRQGQDDVGNMDTVKLYMSQGINEERLDVSAFRLRNIKTGIDLPGIVYTMPYEPNTPDRILIFTPLLSLENNSEYEFTAFSCEQFVAADWAGSKLQSWPEGYFVDYHLKFKTN